MLNTEAEMWFSRTYLWIAHRLIYPMYKLLLPHDWADDRMDEHQVYPMMVGTG